MDFTKISDSILNSILTYGPKVLAALVVFFIGNFVINKVAAVTGKALKKKETDPTLSGFVLSLITALLKVLLFVSVASMLGVATTSFVAVIGAMSLAVGMALQGSLGNFAGGALILLFRPFKVGDLIEAQGNTGHVKEISLFTTNIVTGTNRLVIIPNGPLSNGNIINHSALGSVRVDFDIHISNAFPVEETRATVMEVLNNNPAVLKTPAASVNVKQLNDAGYVMVVNPYCLPEDYWKVFFGTQEQTRIALTKAGIASPVPTQVNIEG
jgi:small conductance mechanosensitive channel